jgi:hypothetical protein
MGTEFSYDTCASMECQLLAIAIEEVWVQDNALEPEHM